MTSPSTLKKVSVIAGTSFGVFGALWTILESFGVEGNSQVFLALTGAALLACAGTFGVRSLLTLYTRAHQLESDLAAATKERDELRATAALLAQRPTSYCCVVQTDKSTCPVGIKEIHTKMSDTLVRSLESATYRFDWHGLSAFNVVHNNRELFKANGNVDYRFSICNPGNKALAQANDGYFNDTAGKLDSAKLITEGDGVLRSLRDEFKLKMDITYHNFVPCFRVVVVDEQTAYVNFYERKKDALETFQLEISREGDFSIFNWFREYIDKIALNETLRTKEEGSS